MQTTTEKIAYDLKVGDVIADHGKTNKTIIEVKENHHVDIHSVRHSGGWIHFNVYDTVKVITTSAEASPNSFGAAFAKVFNEIFTGSPETAALEYNQPGHICPATGRIAMTVADAYAREDSADRQFFMYDPDGKVVDLECWLAIEGICANDTHHASMSKATEGYSLDWSNGKFTAISPGSVVYMQRTKTERETDNPGGIIQRVGRGGRVPAKVEITVIDPKNMPSRFRAVRQGMILNMAQAKAVYDAMCAKNRIIELLCDDGTFFRRLRAEADGCTITVGIRSNSERYIDQAAFAAAYGLS